MPLQQRRNIAVFPGQKMPSHGRGRIDRSSASGVALDEMASTIGHRECQCALNDASGACAAFTRWSISLSSYSWRLTENRLPINSIVGHVLTLGCGITGLQPSEICSGDQSSISLSQTTSRNLRLAGQKTTIREKRRHHGPASLHRGTISRTTTMAKRTSPGYRRGDSF